MSEPERMATALPMRWDTLASGSDLWATVVMASGFVLPAGQTVREHYRIVKTLGQGGMGQVLGVMLVGSPDQQIFALKMVAKSSGPSQDPADQLEAEQQAKAFAALLRGEAAKQELVQRHGVSVARLFALVRFEDGSLGLRMEIARGHSLESFLEEETKQRSDSPPDLAYCLVVMRKVLYQLRRLHELVDPSSPSGFVHSDMKPGNVFVDDGDRYDPFVTLLDFGVATAGHALDIGRSRAAGRKSLILHDAGGTFGFAPPHHFTGKPSPLSDVYAALVILYELIALQSPWDFGGLAKTAANLFKLEDAMRRGPRPVRTGREAIPEAVATALDAFFSTEFRALQQLADEAHVARNAADESLRRAMSERLRTLAQTYQDKVDALRQQLTEGATRSSDPSPSESAEIDARMRARNAPTRVDAPRRDESDRPNSEPTASTLAANDEPLRVPMRSWFGWGSVVMLLAAAAAGSWLWLHGVPREWMQAARGIVDAETPSQPVAETDAAAAAPVSAVVTPDAALTASTPLAWNDAGPIREDANVAAAVGVDVTLTADVVALAQIAVDAASVPDVSLVATSEGVDAGAVLDASTIAANNEVPVADDAIESDAASVATEVMPTPSRIVPPPATSRAVAAPVVNRAATPAAHAPVRTVPTRAATTRTTTTHAAAHSRTPPQRNSATTNRTHHTTTTHRAPTRSTRRPARSTRRR
jgi:serine/threonine protein kinase